jgi:hypothetical protein
MELPKSVRVGYRDYAVVPWPTREADAAGADGYCDKQFGIIRIREGMDAVETLATLWHELRHAAWSVGCIGDDSNEERVVSILSNVDVQIWRDNPDLVAFLSDALA